jgi:hypothetical protein
MAAFLVSYLRILEWAYGADMIKPQLKMGGDMLVMAFRLNDRDTSRKLSGELANIAIKILQETLRKPAESDPQRNKVEAMAFSKIFVRALNKAVKEGFKDRVVTLLDDRATVFSNAIEREHKWEALNLSEVGIVLMTVAMEEGSTEVQIGTRNDWSITEYLAKS